MATSAKVKKLIKLLTDAGVTLTGSETEEELTALVVTNGLDAGKKDSTGVVFKLNDVSTPSRSFSEEEHGENWEDVASEFEKTHAAKIVGKRPL